MFTECWGLSGAAGGSFVHWDAAPPPVRGACLDGRSKAWHERRWHVPQLVAGSKGSVSADTEAGGREMSRSAPHTLIYKLLCFELY